MTTDSQPKPKTIRITVDLQQDRYRTLTAWAAAAAAELGVARVTQAEVMRAFVDLIDLDHGIGAEVLERIRAARTTTAEPG